jgi:hypothetical protein
MKNPQVEVRAYLDEKAQAAVAMAELYTALSDEDFLTLARESTSAEEAYAQKITARLTPTVEQDPLYEALGKAIRQVTEPYNSTLIGQKNRIRRRLRNAQESGTTNIQGQIDFADNLVERYENVGTGVELSVVYADFLNDEEILKLQAPWLRLFGDRYPIPVIITER